MWLHLVTWRFIYQLPTIEGKDTSLFTMTRMHIPVLQTDCTRSQFWFINIWCSHHHDKHTTQLSHVVFITEKAFLLTLELVIVFVCLLGFLCSYLPQSHKPQIHPPLYQPPLNSFDAFSIDRVNKFFFFFKKSFSKLLTISSQTYLLAQTPLVILGIPFISFLCWPVSWIPWHSSSWNVSSHILVETHFCVAC